MWVNEIFSILLQCFGRFQLTRIIIQLQFEECEYCPKGVQISCGILQCTREDRLNRFCRNTQATNWRLSHDVTKILTRKLLFLLRFYLPGLKEQLKTRIHTDLCSEFLFGFVTRLTLEFLSIWVTRHLHDDRDSCHVGYKTTTYLWEFSYQNSSSIRKKSILMFFEFLERESDAFVAKRRDRCSCWFPYKSL